MITTFIAAAMLGSENASAYLTAALAKLSVAPYEVVVQGMTPGRFVYTRTSTSERLAGQIGLERIEFIATKQGSIELNYWTKQYAETGSTVGMGPEGELYEDLGLAYPGMLQARAAQLFGEGKGTLVRTKQGVTLSADAPGPDGVAKVTYLFTLKDEPKQYLVKYPSGAVYKFTFGDFKRLSAKPSHSLTPPTGFSPTFLPEIGYTLDNDAPLPNFSVSRGGQRVALSSLVQSSGVTLVSFSRADLAPIPTQQLASEFLSKLDQKRIVRINLGSKSGDFYNASASEVKLFERYGTPMIIAIDPKRNIIQLWQGFDEEVEKEIRATLGMK